MRKVELNSKNKMEQTLNHPIGETMKTFQQFLESKRYDEGIPHQMFAKQNFYNGEFSLDEGKFRNALGAAALMGGAMFANGYNNAPEQPQTQQVQQQVQQQELQGTFQDENGNSGYRHFDMNPKVAKMYAAKNLAQYLGVNQLPPGIKYDVKQKNDGTYSATAIYDKTQSKTANQTANSMNNAKMIQSY